MGIIRLLDEHIANQIAAGEVVERPSSVVKELVENSIDAGSTRVDVSLEEGGIQLIRVTDNGSGMAAEDCRTAFFRHATSKISSGKDLFHIRTLGFRGEALPSIAAVAKVECLTSDNESGLGRRIVVEGGTVVTEEEAAANRGTDILVKELFYNTPARLKYMKTIQTELGHVSDFMYRLALAHPEIAFSLKHNGNSLLRTLGNGDLLQVIAAVYGSAAAKKMVPVSGETLDYTLTGFISLPEWTRANRLGISSLINGRYIRNYGLVQAILKGYHTLLPINRYPLAAVHLKMDPSLIDVNVHPSKLEVRFSKEAELMQLLEEAVRSALRQEVLIPSGSKPVKRQPVVHEQLAWYGSEPAAAPGEQPLPPPPQAAPPAAADAPTARPAGEAPASEQRPTGPHIGPDDALLAAAAAGDGAPPGASPRACAAEPPAAAGADATAPAPERPSHANDAWRSAAGAASGRGPQARSAAPQGPAASPYGNRSRTGTAGREGGFGGGAGAQARAAAEAAAGVLAQAEAGGGMPAFPRLEPIGQLHGTYILAQNEDGLYMIDQHAAHERINYEYYYDKFGQPQEASQELLVPLTLEFTSAEAERLKERLDYFEQVGVYLESFGGNSFIVRAYPHWFPEGEEKDIIEEMAEWILAEKKQIDVAKLREASSTLCSCKASIKANQRLSLAEIEALLERLASCRIPYTCPHGRPIVVSFSTYELEKMFKRVM
ncbi:MULTISPECIES: DNA mismatch repair endonuclease MutL [unclassified Paenibacillus]|nr:DNA mismatch repair endonuclease MutL [Paenibacillus sp. 32O-W]